MSFNLTYFACIIIIIFPSLLCFYFKTDPIVSVNLISSNSTNKTFLKYPSIPGSDYFRLLQSSQNFLVLGSKDKIVNIFINETQLQFGETIFSTETELNILEKKCLENNCFNYILNVMPIYESNGEFNSLVCGTYYGLYKCFKVFQNQSNGIIDYFKTRSLIDAPKSFMHSLNTRNAFYLSKGELIENDKTEYVLYTASSWTENSQYLAAHTSKNIYQENDIFKKIGVSKSFVRFLENENKIILFHNEISFEVDEGEKDRDILLSTSLVTQFCKNDEEILSQKKPAFYTELTAKIYCFNKAFRSNSGNSKNFKFDSIEYVSDLIKFTDNKNNFTKQLFYGVFNTPKDQITGTAICFFDMQDLSSIFENKNFKNSNYESSNGNSNFEFAPQTCPNLTYTQKEVYNRLTSKLGYMTKAILPVKKRKASFIMTKEYRLSTILVLDNYKDKLSIFPSIKKSNKYDYVNIILAGTDNGKIMRMAHFFNHKYFENDNLEEENFKILEDIQLFENNMTINEIRIIKSKTNISSIVAITNDQIKTISSDFCSLFSTCEQCLRVNFDEDLFNEVCVWNNKCVSISFNNQNFKNNSNEINKCISKPEIDISNKNSNDFILMIRNMSSSQTENFIHVKNSTIFSEKIPISSNQNMNVFFIYIFVSIWVVLSIFLIILLFVLIIKKRNLKFFKKIHKKISNPQCEKVGKNTNTSTEYIDNIYSNVNTNNRNQNFYYNNFQDFTNDRPLNDLNHTSYSDREIAHSSSTSRRMSSKPIHSIQEPSNYIIDYSFISSSLSGQVLDVERTGQFPLNGQISVMNLSQPIKLPNFMENSVIYQEAPSIIIASDDGDQCLENNYMLSMEKQANEYQNSVINSSIYSRNTLF